MDVLGFVIKFELNILFNFLLRNNNSTEIRQYLKDLKL
jgi:hypothetical protein